MDISNELREAANPERALLMARYFKTGKGHYGEGDIFIGLSNPAVQGICKKYNHLSINELQDLIESPLHEFRFAALTILVAQFKKQKENRKEIFDFYLRNVNYINNWDLVDCSCRDIVGAYLFDKDRTLLDEMSEVEHLWTQRIAIVSTWYFIREKQVEDTLRIAKKLILHRHDLIHKAIGWMLREAWKKGATQEVEAFLEENIRQIPRTALRYAIEKMPATTRQEWLKK
jgi:3-methyladenine DNA glycosylase AlkD